MDKETHLDFRYSLKTDYDRSHNCHENHCDENGICRCGKIEDFRIEGIESWDSIVNDLDNFLRPNGGWRKVKEPPYPGMGKDLYEYGLDRIARHYKLYENDGYEATIQNSYYGEEVTNILFRDEKKLMQTLRDFHHNPNPIEFLLNLEYSTILKEALNLKWELKEVDYSDIEAGSKGQIEMVKRNANVYADQKILVVGICLDATKLRLIDGYHRYLASAGKEKVKVFVGIEKD